MILKTTVSVDYNAGITGTENGVVLGKLGNVVWENDFNKIGANYAYFDIDGRQLFQGAFFIENEEIDIFHNQIKASIPTDQDKRDTERNTFTIAFIHKMAETFGITTDEIELIAE